jgi:hypothetical protein
MTHPPTPTVFRLGGKPPNPRRASLRSARRSLCSREPATDFILCESVHSAGGGL